MVIVDSSVWVDYFRAADTSATRWIDHEAARQRLGITDLILYEVLQGVRHEDEFAKTRSELLKLEVFTTGGVRFALAAAANFRELRARGRTVRKTIDCLIATFCIVNGHTLLHSDRDFDPFEQELGLAVLHPDA
jgi:predicted nucleic acid-binding protein